MYVGMDLLIIILKKEDMNRPLTLLMVWYILNRKADFTTIIKKLQSRNYFHIIESIVLRYIWGLQMSWSSFYRKIMIK